jgi:subtilase family serine protease
LRNGPDVSANADFTFYVCANQTTCTANKYGGTSFAAPMWAGYLALVNQSLAASGQGPVGFLNPVIYNQNLVGSTYALDFHDVTSGTSGSYSATTGYDLVTGWGSPTPALVGTLAGLVSAPSLTVSTLAGSLSVAEGGTASTVVDVASAGGFSGAVTLAASGLPSGVSAAFNPATVTNYGASTLTLTASASAPVTTAVPVTITATSGSTTASATVNTAVTVPPSYSLSIAPTALTVARGKSGTATLTETVTGGFASAVSFSASGQPTGVTVSSSKSSLTGAGSVTITFKVASTAAVGTYTITLKGTSGTTSKTTTVALTVQ